MAQVARHRVLNQMLREAGLPGLVDEALPARRLPAREHDEVRLDVAVGVVRVGDVLGEVVELCGADGADAVLAV